jgi:hypothetical protein
MAGRRPVRACPYCSRGYRRLDRHLAGRGSCGLAEDRRRRAALDQSDLHGVQAEQQRAPDAAGAHDDGARAAPPDDLGAAGRRLWGAVMAGFEVTREQVAVLEAAARECDAANLAELAVQADGRLIPDRFGTLKVHPGVAAARSARLAMARLLRELSLEEA